MNRRRFLGTASAFLLSGCIGSTGDASGDAGDFAGHASTRGIDSQPRLGPEDADARVVAFEDPSCPTCRRWEAMTLPELRPHTRDGGLAFYYRGYPVVYPWGEPACHALEATYARSEEAFWSLKNHYYGAQEMFGMGNVLGRTRDYLVEDTGLTEEEAREVVTDARNEVFQDEVDLDLRTGRRAGAVATPTFFLFSGDSYVTKVQGPQGYAVFKNSLRL